MSSTVTKVAARTEGLRKVYGEGDARVEALRGITLAFAEAELTAIMGPSGSGKSTLLHCLAGLDTPTDGSVFICDVDITKLSERHLTELRRDKIGFVFQAYNLIPTLTARENITLPLDIAGRDVDQGWFDQVIDTTGLRDRLTHKPTELSGGQQQRVAGARALVSRPAIVFADEPTGNLDSRSGAELLTFLRQAVDELGRTIVITDTALSSFDQLFGDVFTGTDVVVQAKTAFTPDQGGPGGGGGTEHNPIPTDLLPKVRAIPGVRAADGDVGGLAQIVDPKTGDVIANGGAPTIGNSWDPDVTTLVVA